MVAPDAIEFDGRALPERELFRRLRDLLHERAEQETTLAVLVADPALARRVASFCAISHLPPCIEREGEAWRVVASGTPCRCLT